MYLYMKHRYQLVGNYFIYKEKKNRRREKQRGIKIVKYTRSHTWKSIHRKLIRVLVLYLQTMYSSGYSEMQPAKAKTPLKYVDLFPW